MHPPQLYGVTFLMVIFGDCQTSYRYLTSALLSFPLPEHKPPILVFCDLGDSLISALKIALVNFFQGMEIQVFQDSIPPVFLSQHIQ